MSRDITRCPGWDSNPHWRRFELRGSADWPTGTYGTYEGSRYANHRDRERRWAAPPPATRAERAVGDRDRRAERVAVTEGRRRVLIAEDEALIRLDLREMLVEEGYDVCGEAGDGEAAVKLAQELKPDLCIFDIKMPIMDGLVAAEKIAADRIAPVVILTAFSQRELVEQARAAGAMAYLVKPFQKSDLVPAIEIALSRFAEMRALEAEVANLGDRLETRKLVERAKGMLMTVFSMNEPDAFKWIQRAAMDNRMTMKQVAEKIISENLTAGDKPATP